MFPFCAYSCKLLRKLLTVWEINGLQIATHLGININKQPGSHGDGLHLINKIIFQKKNKLGKHANNITC